MELRAAARVLCVVLAGVGVPSAWGEASNGPQERGKTEQVESESRISDEAKPLQIDEVPERPSLIVELGEPFLGTGKLGPELTLPTGAIWRPAFWVFGTLRTAFGTFDNGLTAPRNPPGRTQASEWVNRLDIFGNVKLSGTERLLVGFRPLDRANGFSGYQLDPQGGFTDEVNLVPRTLLFEGDIGEIFPNLDLSDRKSLDFGFSVGRQSLLFQEGILIDTGGLGNPDALGVVRNNLQFPGMSNMRVTGLYAWNHIFRDDNQEDKDAQLFGLFTETDITQSTVDIDLVYIDSSSQKGNAFFAGIRAVQRFGDVNTTFMVNTSVPTEGETVQTSRGTLLFSQVSRTLAHSRNLVYLNAFWGIDKFSSAIRGPLNGGPLGRTGILFAALGLGRYGAALGNRANNSVGGSLGHQMFFHGTRRQLILELGGRKDTNNTTVVTDQGGLALGGRYQHAIGQRMVAQMDTFGAVYENREPGFGARLELLTQF